MLKKGLCCSDTTAGVSCNDLARAIEEMKVVGKRYCPRSGQSEGRKKECAQHWYVPSGPKYFKETIKKKGVNACQLGGSTMLTTIHPILFQTYIISIVYVVALAFSLTAKLKIGDAGLR